MACSKCRQVLRVPAVPVAQRVQTDLKKSSVRKPPRPVRGVPPSPRLRSSRRPKPFPGLWIVGLLVAIGLTTASFFAFSRLLGHFPNDWIAAEPVPREVPSNVPEPDVMNTSRPIAPDPGPKITSPPEKQNRPAPPPQEKPKDPGIFARQPLGKINPSLPVQKDTNWFVCFPPNGQDQVPLIFPGNEVPDPLPEMDDKTAGYPVTVTFAPQAVVRNVTAELKDADKKTVAVWLSSPENPANPKHPREQANTICLLAKKPLQLGCNYSVTISATVDGKDWSHTWKFTTISAAAQRQQIDQPALESINRYRGFAGLDPVVYDPGKSAACLAHARYLVRNVPGHPGLNWNDEDDKLPGYTAEGKQVASGSAVFLGGGAMGLIDWMFSSFLNRHSLLEPNLRTIGLGYTLFPNRGWIWVLYVRGERPTGPTREPLLYPVNGQKEVPTYMMRSSPYPVPKSAQKEEAGFAITARMPLGQTLAEPTARLTDASGMDVPFWLSTPDNPAVPGYSQFWIGIIPKEPLQESMTYKVALEGKLGTQPWQKTWSFQTMSHDEKSKGLMAKHLLARVNKARTEAGLSPVEIDPELSRACELHAQYSILNFAHPSLQGLGMHNEDPKRDGYTLEGQRAGRNSVIANDGNPLAAVDSWLATLYHRVPLLHPSLKRIGVANARLPDQNWISILDCSTDVRRR
jgi:uncharacterized protein YkwD